MTTQSDELPLLTQALQELLNNERWLGWMTGNMKELREFAVEMRDTCEKEWLISDELDNRGRYMHGCRNAYQTVVEKIDALYK